MTTTQVPGNDATTYMVDAWQRAILTWDMLRERGNQYLEHERSGKPAGAGLRLRDRARRRAACRSPRTTRCCASSRPTGHPPIDPKKRPFVIIDPRAGHGPGIGGFKDDSRSASRCSTATRATSSSSSRTRSRARRSIDVCAAEIAFVRKVRELHPDAARKPVVDRQLPGRLGADDARRARAPRTIGPIVINGAPMSYWGGACEGENPMRYVGRDARRHLARVAHWPTWATASSTARTWCRTSRTSNPANTYWDKYYNLYRQGRHRAAALPRVRALVGRLLPHEPRGDRVDRRRTSSSATSSRPARSQSFDGKHRVRPARHPVADHPVRLDGRQHHAAAAGVQLGRRRLRQRRGDQGATAR